MSITTEQETNRTFTHPTEIAGLVSFWDFQEPEGRTRIAKGANAYPLYEVNGPVPREEGGLFGPYAAHIETGMWFVSPRSECPRLDVHGTNARFTFTVWFKCRSNARCQTLAGMWDETRKKRQYCLFYNLSGRYQSEGNVHAHISATGGHTPGEPVCATYATGGTQLAFETWYAATYTYDGAIVRLYLNGTLDRREGLNPYYYDKGVFDGGANGADFTVASVSTQGGPLNFFTGAIGGIAFYDRVLAADEICALAAHCDKAYEHTHEGADHA